MPKVHEMLKSSFLKKEDVGAGLLVTISGCEQQNVAKEGAEPELKWCLLFEECDKPLVLNSTNIQVCKIVCGSDDTDEWVGHKVVLYTDPNVSYGGKLVGGIRMRAPKTKAAPAKTTKAPAPVTVATGPDLTDDDIPFMWLLALVPMLGAFGA